MNAEKLLERYRDKAEEHYTKAMSTSNKPPQDLDAPLDPNEALRLGWERGRSSGYQLGIFEGAKIGLEILFKSMEDEMKEEIAKNRFLKLLARH